MPEEETQFDIVDSILTTLDGAIQSQGIKVKACCWINMGSIEWAKTPNEVKAYAYQAAVVNGWTDTSLKCIMREAFPHITESLANCTIEQLKEFAVEYPATIDN